MGTIKPEEGILHDEANSDKILKMIADTMFLLLRDGTCIDIVLHTDRWFLQKPEKIIGKNIFDFLPSETSIALRNNFNKVFATGISSSDNYEMQIGEKKYFFKCIIYLYDKDHVLCQYRDITKRILLKKALENANRQLEDVEKVAMIGRWIYDSSNGNILYGGNYGVGIYFSDIHSIKIKDVKNFIYEDDKNSFEKFCEMASKYNKTVTSEFRIKFEDKIFYLKVSTVRSYFENGRKVLEGFAQNITDIKESQLRLEMVTRAVSNSTDYIFAMKSNGEIMYGNQRFKELHGWDIDEDVTLHNIFDSKTALIDEKKWKEIILQVKSTKQVVSFAINRIVPEDQSTQSFDCTSYLIKDSAGDDLVWTFGKDITERIHYDKQVKELNQIMSTVLSNIPMHISVKDVNNGFRYIFSNQAGGNFQSGLMGHIIGKNDFEIYPEDIATKMREEDINIVEGEGSSRKYFQNTDEKGNLQIIDQSRIFIGDELRPLLITIDQDVTNSKRMEKELVNAKEKAEQSDRLKSAFIANMSHEIRTPLNAIVGFSRIIAETENIDERKTYYSIVEANNERLLGLINEILDLSKIESGIMEFDSVPIRMSEFGEDIRSTMSIRCPDEVKLIFEASDNNIVILCDKNRLTQVFTNLISNAIKFTTKGSIRFGYYNKNGHLEFFVKDTGKGISPEKVNKVFDRFVKADNFTQGTGLGLSICKSIIERMGGEIKVTSKQGSGTCFTFTLPDCNIMYRNPDNSSFQTQTTDDLNYNCSILVAEDTDSNYKLIYAMIGKNYKLFRAINGYEAISLCKGYKPDLILMDIKMPELDGLEATKIIREDFPDIPIIAQSAFAFEEDRLRAIDSGCTDFIAKPFTKKQLSDLLKKYLR